MSDKLTVNTWYGFENIANLPDHFGNILDSGGVSLAFENKESVTSIQSTTRSIPFLKTLEALWQRGIRPTINTKDEYRSRELTLKL